MEIGPDRSDLPATGAYAALMAAISAPMRPHA